MIYYKRIQGIIEVHIKRVGTRRDSCCHYMFLVRETTLREHKLVIIQILRRRWDVGEIERKISIQRKVRFRPSDDIWIVLMICKDKEHIDSNTYQRAE